MTIISYAQNFEDIILWRALKHIHNGFYIDIGAHHPEIDSVSKTFYDNGWTGINVEPVKEYSELLKRERPNDQVIEAAISDTENITTTIYEIENSGLSTIDKNVAIKHRNSGYTIIEKTTASTTIDNIITNANEKEIHWMKIDVEGAEEMAINGWKTCTNLPWILVVESTKPNTQVQSHKKWDKTIKEKGYIFCHFDGLNRFYLSKEHPELKKYLKNGPNIFDVIHNGFVLSKNTPFCSFNKI